MGASASSENIRRVVAELERGELVRNYLRDFRELSGVTVDFRSSEKWPPCNSGEKCKNPFCALLVDSGGICTACLGVERELAEPCASRSVKCLAGLRETAVPVVLEGNAIAFLVVHPVLHHHPTKRAFHRVLHRLRERGIVRGIKALEASYLASPVMSSHKQKVVVNLLTAFASTSRSVRAK